MRLDQQLQESQPFARLQIPAIDVDLMVATGVTWEALRGGAGWYPRTSYPGQPGNVAVAGHSDQAGAPFRELGSLREGDEAIVSTPEDRFVYRLVAPFDEHSNPWTTHSRDFTVIQPTVDPSLTITTNDPSVRERRIIARFEFAG